LRVQGTQKRQGPGKAILGAFANAVVMARVIHFLQPTGQFAVEFFHGPDSLTWQTQAGFEILLQSPEHPLYFAAAPRLSRLGMDEPDAQVSADDLEVVIDERPPIVAVQLSRQTSAPQ